MPDLKLSEICFYIKFRGDSMVRESLQEATKCDNLLRKNVVTPSKPAAGSTAGLPERSNRQRSPHRFSHQCKKKFRFCARHRSHTRSRSRGRTDRRDIKKKERLSSKAPAASGGGEKPKSGDIVSLKLWGCLALWLL